MTTPRRGLLFHFTHISHLESIATSGLAPDNLVQVDGRLVAEVGNQRIKDGRRHRTVPVGPGGLVADYVPFYFAARSPTLGSIHVGNVPSYQGHQDDLVYLVSSIDRVVEMGLPFVYTDRNAYYDYAKYGTDLDKLEDLVDWKLMEQRDWFNTEDEPDRMERRMAEFLVHGTVPWAAFLGVATISDAVSQRVEQALSSVGVATEIRVRREWYF